LNKLELQLKIKIAIDYLSMAILFLQVIKIVLFE